MKITALKTFVVPPRWLFLKIETDEGISGWGEPVLEGHAQTLATYRLMDDLKAAHPGLEIESCSSGGSRALPISRCLAL